MLLVALNCGSDFGAYSAGGLEVKADLQDTPYCLQLMIERLHSVFPNPEWMALTASRVNGMSASGPSS